MTRRLTCSGVSDHPETIKIEYCELCLHFSCQVRDCSATKIPSRSFMGQHSRSTGNLIRGNVLILWSDAFVVYKNPSWKRRQIKMLFLVLGVKWWQQGRNACTVTSKKLGRSSEIVNNIWILKIVPGDPRHEVDRYNGHHLIYVENLNPDTNLKSVLELKVTKMDREIWNKNIAASASAGTWKKLNFKKIENYRCLCTKFLSLNLPYDIPCQCT